MVPLVGLVPPSPEAATESTEIGYRLTVNEQFCVFCGGDPNAHCREGVVTSDGFRLVFVGNMEEDEALALGYRVSGRVRTGGRVPLYHAYRGHPI